MVVIASLWWVYVLGAAAVAGAIWLALWLVIRSIKKQDE